MRTRKTLIAAAACAFTLVPATFASAGTGPAPASDQQRADGRKSTVPSAAGNPASTKARAAQVCADAYQIGETAYIDSGTTRVASVKQFYSPKCEENYGYVWVWDSFRDQTNMDWDVTVGVYSFDQDKYLGQRTWRNTRGQEFWSSPADTVKECTTAVGFVRHTSHPLPAQATTDSSC
ncbi:hypothetical protein [Streptomyces sp. NPDC048142]|uniref:hypothetical protein n=1 Tax=Streptomyces sp. NPDC048142 TaxID=3365501 RepID=UPI003716F679